MEELRKDNQRKSNSGTENKNRHSRNGVEHDVTELQPEEPYAGNPHVRFCEGVNPRGFTLLELLAVLVILAALATIAIPIFINKSNEAKQVAHDENIRTLQKQAQMYMLSHESVGDSDDIIDAMVAEGFIKERPTYPINSLNTYAVEVVSGIPTVKLNGPVSPTLGITADTPDTTNATSITYTFTFSEPVTGFDESDITVNIGTKGAFAGSGAVYTLVVTNSDIGSTQTITVADGAATAITGGLANIGDSKSIILVDVPVAPTLVITSNPISPTYATSITYTFTFSAPVTGFDINDIGVNIGTKGAFGGTGAVYTLVVTNANLGSTQTITVADGAAIATTGGLTSIGDSKSILLAKTGADVVLGNYLKFGTYNATPIVWRVINKVDQAYLDANPGSGIHVGDLMLFSDKIISIKAFDAAGQNLIIGAGGDADRGFYGSNYWDKSNLKAWLNSSAGAGVVSWLGYFSPTAARVFGGYNPYDAEKGFLADGNFNGVERSKIMPVTHKTILANTDAATAAKTGGTASHTFNDTNASTAVQNYDDANYKDTTESVFLLGIKELNDYVYSNGALGNGETWIKAYPTSQAVTQSTVEGYNTGEYGYYWLRDSYALLSYYVRGVYADGTVAGFSGAYDGRYGVRPALFLSPSGMTLDGVSGTSVGEAMTITWQ